MDGAGGENASQERDSEPKSYVFHVPMVAQIAKSITCGAGCLAAGKMLQ
jgi:hypothetical protein